MSYSHFPELSALGLVETLNTRIVADNERLHYEDVFRVVQQMGSFRRDGKMDIDFLMFDGDFFVPLVRLELLERFEKSIPHTWDDVVELARFFDGKVCAHVLHKRRSGCPHLKPPCAVGWRAASVSVV